VFIGFRVDRRALWALPALALATVRYADRSGTNLATTSGRVTSPKHLDGGGRLARPSIAAIDLLGALWILPSTAGQTHHT
jgi:hypothetical protein